MSKGFWFLLICLVLNALGCVFGDYTLLRMFNTFCVIILTLGIVVELER